MAQSQTATPDARIDNYVDVIHALTRITHLRPSGENRRTEVDNPAAHGAANPPSYLRVKVPRDGWTFKIAEEAATFGLVIADAWQLTADHEQEAVMVKLVPKSELFG